MTFQEELLELLKKYEIEYDERYIWDWLRNDVSPFQGFLEGGTITQGVALGWYVMPF